MTYDEAAQELRNVQEITEPKKACPDCKGNGYLLEWGRRKVLCNRCNTAG